MGRRLRVSRPSLLSTRQTLDRYKYSTGNATPGHAEWFDNFFGYYTPAESKAAAVDYAAMWMSMYPPEPGHLMKLYRHRITSGDGMTAGQVGSRELVCQYEPVNGQWTNTCGQDVIGLALADVISGVTLPDLMSALDAIDDPDAFGATMIERGSHGFNPEPEPPAYAWRGGLDSPLTLRGFNPQPEPPARDLIGGISAPKHWYYYGLVPGYYPGGYYEFLGSVTDLFPVGGADYMIISSMPQGRYQHVSRGLYNANTHKYEKWMRVWEQG